MRQPFDLMLGLMLGQTRQAKYLGEGRQFVVVQLEHVCQLERLLDQTTRIELLPKINVKNAQRVCWRLRDQLLNCIARGLAALGQTSEADCVCPAGGDKSFRCYSNMVPSHIFLNGEMGKPIARQRDLRSPRGYGVINLYGGFRQAHLMKAANDFASVVILPHTRDDLSLCAQSVRMIGEVRWRSAELWPSEKQVPQHFPHADHIRVHGKVHAAYSMPSCFWICSSGTPFVSGTIVFTQMSCRTIMPAKNAKT